MLLFNAHLLPSTNKTKCFCFGVPISWSSVILSDTSVLLIITCMIFLALLQIKGWQFFSIEIWKFGKVQWWRSARVSASQTFLQYSTPYCFCRNTATNTKYLHLLLNDLLQNASHHLLLLIFIPSEFFAICFCDGIDIFFFIFVSSLFF